MPNAMNHLGQNLPRFTGSESTEDQVALIQNYLYQLLEELRYLLRNLGVENFNDQSLIDLSNVVAGNVKAETIVTNNFITNELYSRYGEISDLVVWKLRTDYKKIDYFQRGKTDDINYLYIHDEQIDLMTDSVIMPASWEQLERDGRKYWWKDYTEGTMTSTEITPYPVMVYKYQTLTKATLRFEDITLDGGQHAYAPRLTMGAGDLSENSKGYIFKNQTGLELSYTKTGTGELRKVYIGDNGVEITKPIVDADSYGTQSPIERGLPGVDGQLYFQIVG
ncbi:MAG: hypothetical protein MJ074_08430 [Oscillospiraceae bacterium]|nr:hypothetical protein [Oscillospiraceae bacterium]